jgi:hypothetical protein
VSASSLSLTMGGRGGPDWDMGGGCLSLRVASSMKRSRSLITSRHEASGSRSELARRRPDCRAERAEPLVRVRSGP